MRIGRVLLCSMLLALALGGCSKSSDDSSRGSTTDGQSEVDLRFAYVAIADAGAIDQTLTITNTSGDLAAVPTLSFQALDAAGEPVTGVKVATVFGSDRGRVMAPANYEVFDILRFDGARSDLVEDVEVTVEDLRTESDAGAAYPTVDYLDAQGRSVDFPNEAHTVRVHNSGAQEYVVRLVGIRWNQPVPGRSQQADQVSEIGDAVSVDARGSADIPLPKRAVGRFDSLKVYISLL